MNRFVPAEVVFNEKLPPSVSPPFSKSENGGENRASLPQIPFFGNLGEAGGGPSLIEIIITFDLRISGFMSLLNLTL